MSDDSREANAQPPPKPKGPANTMPGGTAHTAGGMPADGGSPTYLDAVRSLGPEYYLNFHRRPCVRDSLLVAIPAGFAGGSLAAMFQMPVRQCTNVAVLCIGGFGCASYQYCQYFRSKEKDGMRQARELMERKRIKIEARKEERRRQREQYERELEAQRIEEERRKSWKYWAEKNIKFW